MTFHLKNDSTPNHWIITSEHGNIVSGPRYYQRIDHAIEWANQFISSWRGATLVVEEK